MSHTKGIRVSKTGADDDKASIDEATQAFFKVFDNRNGAPELDRLHQLCLESCVIVKTCGDGAEIYSLPQFIEPRDRLLNGGDLVEFSEQEIWERTDIFGDVAQRLCAYEKSGVMKGEPFQARGMKSIQWIRTSTGWKVSAVAWDDERPGLTIPPTLSP